MKGALRKGSTGEQILEILEALTSPTVPNTYGGDESNTQEAQYGTLEDIEFWYSRLHIGGQNLMAFVTLWVVTVCYTEGAICPLPDITVIWLFAGFVVVVVEAPIL